MTDPPPSEVSKLKELLAEQTSARERAEVALEELENRHRAILNSVNEIVFQTDLKGNWTFLNSAWSDFLELSVRENLGRPFTEHLNPDDRARAQELIDALATGDAELCRAELRFCTGSGDERWFELLARLTVEGEGAGSGITGTLADITARRRAETELEKANRNLMEASRAAGMAEVASGVLHNVGNVLNSVNISVGLVIEHLRKSKTASLAKAVELLRAHKQDVGEFLMNDAKGRQLPAFFEALSEQLTREQALLARETQGLQQNIEHIKQIVAMQQSYAKVSGALENLAPHELVEDALRMSSTALAQNQIEVVRQFETVPLVLVDRHLVLQILVNLISNANHALDQRTEGRRLLLHIACGEGECVRVEVTDNGAGIPQENLNKIFQHGFTTKKTGHGFGLHSGANAAREMGGSLNVLSDGPGTGATFILELPVNQISTAQRAA